MTRRRDEPGRPELELILGGAAASRDLADPAGGAESVEELQRLLLWYSCLGDLVAAETARLEAELDVRRGQARTPSPRLAGDRLFEPPPPVEAPRLPQRPPKRVREPLPEQTALFGETAELPAVEEAGQLEMLRPRRDFGGLDALRAAEAERSGHALDRAVAELRRESGLTDEEERFLRDEAAVASRLAARDDLPRRLREALLARRQGKPRT